MTRIGKPLILGTLMGGLMLWMAHGLIEGKETLVGWALVGFIGVHLALIAVVAGAGFYSASLSPRARTMIARLHRPNPRHIAIMVLGAVGTAALTHVVLHGEIV